MQERNRRFALVLLNTVLWSVHYAYLGWIYVDKKAVFISSNAWLYGTFYFFVRENLKTVTSTCCGWPHPSPWFGRCWVLHENEILSLLNTLLVSIRGGADKSLSRPGRKQATAPKLGIYSTYSPRSSIHCLACCSNVCKPLKKIQKFVRPTRSTR